MTTVPRTPFAALHESRLQALGSLKNRQNNINPLLSSPLQKAPSSAPAKRRLASDLLSDESDLENIDPAAFVTPSTKRSKGLDGTPSKVSKFVLSTASASGGPIIGMKRKAASLAQSASVPTTTTTTPVALHGKPIKDRRVSLLSGKLRTRAKTPVRRFDPPASTKSGGLLPFSIDAALSATLNQTTTPTFAKATPTTSPSLRVSKPSATLNAKAQPKSWFFSIHEDTPEQEATNLMEHSASILDISSDDDAETCRAKEALERGKENIPPPDYQSTRSARQQHGSAISPHIGIQCPKKMAKYSEAPDVMLEDRGALREMDAGAFWGADVEDGNAVVTIVDEDEDAQFEQKKKKLEEVVKSRMEAMEELVAEIEVPVQLEQKEEFIIREDTPEKEICETENAELEGQVVVPV